MARSWTPEQANAINARGGSLLVSAAAGSGKTAVLVERVIRRIEDRDNPVRADRLVVTTFSNAAAAEIRERVEAALEERLAQRPDDYGLRRQQMLLAKAHIGTIHSFCLDLIRNNFQALSVPCDFRIGEENELALLRVDACEEVIEEAYAAGDDAFLALVELVSSSRDDRALVDIIERLHGFVRTHPFPDEWLQETLKQYDPSVPVQETPWGKQILRYAVQALTHAVDSLKWAVSTIQSDDLLIKAYLAAFQQDKNNAEELLKHAQDSNWDDLYKTLRTCSFARLGALRGFTENGLQERLKSIRESYKKTITSLRKQICATTAQHSEDMTALRPLVQALFNLVRAFSARYDEKKRERALLDFSDLEQLALRLLVDKQNGQTVITPLARTVADTIDEIYIDEYQDVNEAQDEIFGAISKNRTNLFMVGDVKQSIYRFRHASPELFLRYKDEFAPYDGTTYPARIILGRNFRSRKGVTDAVNFIFHQIMSRDAGEIDYNDDEKLIPAAQYPDADHVQMHLHIIDRSQADDEDSDIQLEARHIAQTIKQLIDTGLPVTENGRQRPATYGDFAILLRSVKDRASVYTKELNAYGIPVMGDAGGDALHAQEVAVLISLLRVIDNPLSDIDLAAVLLSPMFRFTATELAEMRLAAPREPLYLAAQRYAAEASEKTRACLDILSILRVESVTLSVDRLIERALRLTDYDLRVRAMPNGAKRLANLRLLCEYAHGREQAGYGGLPRFVGYLSRMMEEGQTLGEAPAFYDTDDTVKIMSIHKSKGLEFPVCFVADCAKQFNRSDAKEQSLLHPRLGFSCKQREPETLKQYTTVPHEAIKLAITQGAVAEEMRVLYVALTRAKEYLYITATEKNPESKLTKLGVAVTTNETLNPFTVMNASSFSDWIYTAAMRREEAGKLRELAGLDNSVVLDTSDEEAWEIEIIEPTARQEQVTEAQEDKKPASQPDPELVERLQRKIEFKYPYQHAVEIPTKLAVSDLAKKMGTVLLSTPSFAQEDGLTPTQKGNALHKFMQFANYQNAQKDPAAELERMQRLCYLSAEEVQAIDRAALEKFFQSALAHRMFASKRLMRELKFVSSVSAGELDGGEGGHNAQDDMVMIQGVADCVFYEDDGLVIVDYKTDRVSDPKDLVDRYALQLYYYKRALEQSLGLPVKQCLLYSFHLGCEIEV